MYFSRRALFRCCSVDDLVAKNAVMVFSKTYCPYCQKAKQTLANYAINASKYKVLELGLLQSQLDHSVMMSPVLIIASILFFLSR